MSPSLHFAEHTLQEVALIFMALVYIFRIRWILGFKAGKERQAPNPTLRTNYRKGILYSWANIALPWSMESTRTKWFFYMQFVVFHLGVATAIALSFVIPYYPGLIASGLALTIIKIILGAAFLVGLTRIVRRIFNKIVAAISTPDDYFSLFLLTAWLLLATLSAGNPTDNEPLLLAYFWMTAFFLIYVPFSKISHYLYYPFTRYYLGRSLGRRGVYPIERRPA